MDLEQSKINQRFLHLIEILKILRGDNGCPWDKQQTHQSIRPYLLEEAYEVAEAIDKDDFIAMKEELGDLLFQILFHIRLAEEKKQFTLEQVLDNIINKMITRHPHIFGDTKVSNAKEVIINWELIKQEEKKRTSVIDGVPRILPALLRARRIQEKAASVGFDWKEIEPVIDKIEEEINEFKETLKTNDIDMMTSEMGDIFFALVNLSRFMNIDPEAALQKTSDKFIRRFHYIEKCLKEKDKSPNEVSLAEMDKFWEEAKKSE